MSTHNIFFDRGASNEYPQHIFCGEIRKKNISTFWMKKRLIWSYVLHSILRNRLIRPFLDDPKSSLNRGALLCTKV